eukprot:CCRYP_016262-RA/>CCRYP_016262-RA protein AED:0.00 eAED:0.00 QI:83/1/1/1/0/0/3/21/51
MNAQSSVSYTKTFSHVIPTLTNHTGKLVIAYQVFTQDISVHKICGTVVLLR